MGTDPRRRNLSPPPLSVRATGATQSSERLSKSTGAEPRRRASPCRRSYVQHLNRMDTQTEQMCAYMYPINSAYHINLHFTNTHMRA